MKPKEFFDLVADMRKAQKEYFKTPASAYKAKQDALSKSKKLEKQVAAAEHASMHATKFSAARRSPPISSCPACFTP